MAGGSQEPCLQALAPDSRMAGVQVGPVWRQTMRLAIKNKD